VEVRRISVVPDEVEPIAREVAEVSSGHDFVFTSGGVGPTHDDVTMEGLARAFGVDLVRNGRLMELIRSRCSGEERSAAEKMAMLPEGAELIEAPGLGFPALAMRNVYVFPGIPEFMVKKFEALRERFRTDPFLLKKLYLAEDECAIARHLEAVAREYPHVMVGSYPKVGIEDYQVIVTLESRDSAALSKAHERLMALLPEGSVVRAK
jgi:molybdopterin-biosynthesis enzyme MoeA-like protein